MLVMLVMFSNRGKFSSRMRDPDFYQNLIFCDTGLSIGNSTPFELNQKMFVNGREVINKTTYQQKEMNTQAPMEIEYKHSSFQSVASFTSSNNRDNQLSYTDDPLPPLERSRSYTNNFSNLEGSISSENIDEFSDIGDLDDLDLLLDEVSSEQNFTELPSLSQYENPAYRDTSQVASDHTFQDVDLFLEETSDYKAQNEQPKRQISLQRGSENEPPYPAFIQDNRDIIDADNFIKTRSGLIVPRP